MARFQSVPRWLQIVAIVIAISGGLVTVGVTMPWDALSRAEAAEKYETKSEAATREDLCEQRFDLVWRTLERIERKLDRLIGP